MLESTLQLIHHALRLTRLLLAAAFCAIHFAAGWLWQALRERAG